MPSEQVHSVKFGSDEEIRHVQSENVQLVKCSSDEQIKHVPSG